MPLPLPPEWRVRVLVAASSLAVGKCETGENSGTIPEYCQRITGNKPPDYWCASAVARLFERGLRRRSPVLLTASCEQQRQRAMKRRALRTRQEFDDARAIDPLRVAGWVFFCIETLPTGELHAHHTGVVGVIDDDGDPATLGEHGGFLTTEGNAADPTKKGSRNGDGFYAGRERGHPADLTVYQFADPEALI